MKNKNVWLILMVLIANMFFVGTASARNSITEGRTDYFGYTFNDSDEPSANPQRPSYSWIELSTSPYAKEILNSSDDSFRNVTIPFNFNYYGIDYREVNITNNGLILSNPGTGQYLNEPIGNSEPDNFIAAFWDDIVTWGSAGAIYYECLNRCMNPQNNVFVVEWNNNQHYNNSTLGITFEALLFEKNNSIKFQYKDTSFGTVYNNVSGDLGPFDNGGSATIGIEGPSGQGLNYSFNTPNAVRPGHAILFRYPIADNANLLLSKRAPSGAEDGSTMTYTLTYLNIGIKEAANKTFLNDTLDQNVTFLSASDNGAYNPSTRNVTWDIGTVDPSGTGSWKGSRTVTVQIPEGVDYGTVIHNNASIRYERGTRGPPSTIQYKSYDTRADTMVTGLNLPDDVNIEGINGNSGGTPSLGLNRPVTFYYNNSICPGGSGTIRGVSITIKIGSNTIVSGQPMTEIPPGSGNWTYTTSFSTSGKAEVTYTITSGCILPDPITFNIYIDPAGYIYDTLTGSRISGATVWLQQPDGDGGWEDVPTGQTPPVMLPDMNPNITYDDGQYQWLTREGIYRVYVTASGYYSEVSRVVIVDDETGPITDLHVGLTRIDPTPPIIIPTVTGTQGDNGWYTSNVTVSWEISDPDTGIASSQGCSETELLADTADTTLTCSVVNGVGFPNSSSVTLRIDKTPPSIEITVPATGASYTINQPVAADYSCSDALSGATTCIGTVANGTNIDTGIVGPKSFSVTSTDNAGNTATTTSTYNVDYNFNGFLQPIDNLPTLNALKAGSAVPVKFSLNGDQGLDIFEAGYPRSAVTQCDSTAPVDAVDEISTAGSSSLSYDAATDQYNYVWKTEKAWAGGCRQLVVMLKDGTDHRANFKFLK